MFESEFVWIKEPILRLTNSQLPFYYAIAFLGRWKKNCFKNKLVFWWRCNSRLSIGSSNPKLLYKCNARPFQGQTNVGQMSIKCRTNVGQMLNKHCTNVGQTLDKGQTKVGQRSDKCRTNVGQTSDKRRTKVQSNCVFGQIHCEQIFACRQKYYQTTIFKFFSKPFPAIPVDNCFVRPGGPVYSEAISSPAV
jgi:hypothetical protein